jgi:hypothetical protein
LIQLCYQTVNNFNAALTGRRLFIFTFAEYVAHNSSYAARFEHTIIHQHVHLRRESQSHALAHALMRLYSIDKSLVCLQSERRGHVEHTIDKCYDSHNLKTERKSHSQTKIR